MEITLPARGVSRPVSEAVQPAARSAAPGVTIAIPNWNHEYVLPRSVGSALRAVADLSGRGVGAEVLVVDDGSRDGSLPLLRQMEALYFPVGLRLVALARNVGLPAARNRALAEASYRHVLFMDADNELIAANVFHFHRSMAATGAAAVYGTLLRRGRPSGDGDGMGDALSNESFQDRIFEDNYIDAFALFDRDQLLDVGGYLESAEVRAREDWEMYLHLAAAGRRVVFVPLVLGIYHDLAHSMIKGAGHEDGSHKNYLRRVFDQLGLRRHLPLNTRHLRYHPDIGYI